MIANSMDFDLLRAFVTVCRVRSMTKAAPILCRTQSALSMQMKRLEALVGRRLLHRTGRGVVPTAEGLIFLNYAESVVVLTDETVMRIKRTPKKKTLSIGLPEEIALSSLPTALAAIKSDDLDLDLDIQVGHTVRNEPLWRQKTLDIMIGVPSRMSAEAMAKWPVDLQWVCGHDYIRPKSDLLEIVVFDDPCTWCQLMVSALKSAGLDYTISFKSCSVNAVLAAVAQGYGISALPANLVTQSDIRFDHDLAKRVEPLQVLYGMYSHDLSQPIQKSLLSAFVGSACVQ